MMSTALMQITDLSKIYRMGEIDVHALDHVSLTINEGEFIVILGPSGSGKSTLLNIIGGMDTATSGEVRFGKDVITNYNQEQLTSFRRNKVGFVFQFYNLMSTLTARENVELAAEISKDPLDIDETLAWVNLEARKDHFPSQLSGGEQQRVAIARAIAKKPDLLLCDEPTGALDFQTGIAILQVLKEINQRYKKTVVVITHNTPIAQMAERVIKMRSGQIVDDQRNLNPLPPEAILW